MIVTSPKKARKFFEAKMNFTTGPVELDNMMKCQEDINIVDVRQLEDYAKGHIPGSVNLPKDKWEEHTGLSKDKVNVVYCYSQVCHLAAAAARNFAEHDYPVVELEGGFEAWQRHNLPVEV